MGALFLAERVFMKLKTEAISILLAVGICVPELTARTTMLLGNRARTTASCLRDNGGARAFSYSLGFFCM